MTSASSQPLRPFPAAPDTRRYFPASVVEEARQRLARTIASGEGPMLVVGAAGTGKSLLQEVLAEQFREQMAVVSLVGAQLCTRRALLQMILFELGLSYRDMDEGELRLSIVENLRPLDKPARRMLLLVDEADSLPMRLLQELRALTNISDQGQPLVSLVLSGSAILEELFADPQLEVFSQRLATRCYLAPFGREETFQYVRAQIAASGGEPDTLFNQDGLEAVFAATDGVPRLINQLGSQLVWMASETGYQPLDGAIVQQAWSELQQLPAPWNTQESQPVACESDAEVVEFGALNEMPASIPFDAKGGRPSANGSSAVDESVDQAELLLAELDDLRPLELTPPEPPKPPKAKNPFDESFDIEEVMLDQYAAFEGRLLRNAPRVFNQIDLQLARELERCETRGQMSTTAQNTEQLLAPFPRDEKPQSKPSGQPSPAAPTNGKTAQPGLATSVTIAGNGATARPTSPSSVLVVEDERPASEQVVQKGQFRHLFSRLES